MKTIKAHETHRTVGGKEYLVRSVFIGEKDIKSVLLDLAERKALQEMGLNQAIEQK